jgi:hypothetical protein
MARPRGKADDMEKYSSTSIASIKKFKMFIQVHTPHSQLTFSHS